MTAIKMLAVDIDGTLVIPGEKRVYAGAKTALARAHDQGIKVIIVTGRRYRTSVAVVEDLGLPLDVICLGGALVVDRSGTVQQRSAIPSVLVEKIVDLARQHHLTLASHQHHQDQPLLDFVQDEAVQWNRWSRQHFELHQANAKASLDRSELAHRNTLTLSFFGDKAELFELQKQIDDLCSGQLYTTLVREPVTHCGYLEVNLQGVNKWSALQGVAAREQIKTEQICAVGDDFNDLPMIKGAGFGVAMGSGNPQIAQHANWVTGAVDGDGIERLVQRILA